MIRLLCSRCSREVERKPDGTLVHVDPDDSCDRHLTSTNVFLYPDIDTTHHPSNGETT